MKQIKGYISPTVCIDGKDSHEWENKKMKENGKTFTVTHCKKCGYWY